MTDIDKKQIAEKVQKLLNLSSSSNVNEAGLAAAKAQEILEKYGMTLTDVQIQTEEMSAENVSFNYNTPGFKNKKKKKIEYWQSILASVIKNHYFVETVIITERMDGQWYEAMQFIGAKQDVEVAVYIYQYLYRKIGRLTTKALAEATTHGLQDAMDFRKSFNIGAVNGINQKLNEEAKLREKPKTMNGSDLVVIKNAAAVQYKNTLFPKSNKVHHKVNNSSNSGYHSGLTAGKNISIRTGVGGSSNGQKRIG